MSQYCQCCECSGYEEYKNSIASWRTSTPNELYANVTFNTTKATSINTTGRYLKNQNTANIKRLKYGKRKMVPRIYRQPTKPKSRFNLYMAGVLFLALGIWMLQYYSPDILTDDLSQKLGHGLLPEECEAKVMRLTAALSRTEHALKMKKRFNEFWNVALKHNLRGESKEIPFVNLAEDSVISVGAETKEWDGGIATLLGVIPLWETSPSPYTIVANRSPIRGDCWPFKGSQGEVIIELSRKANLHSISIEHVRPDINNSAPKKFSIYVILDNGSKKQLLQEEYTHVGPAQQHYQVNVKSVKRLTWVILTNHGNVKYTCIYRLRLYGNFE